MKFIIIILIFSLTSCEKADYPLPTGKIESSYPKVLFGDTYLQIGMAKNVVFSLIDTSYFLYKIRTREELIGFWEPRDSVYFGSLGFHKDILVRINVVKSIFSDGHESFNRLFYLLKEVFGEDQDVNLSFEEHIKKNSMEKSIHFTDFVLGDSIGVLININDDEVKITKTYGLSYYDEYNLEIWGNK